LWMLSEWKMFRSRFIMVIPNRRAKEIEDKQKALSEGAEDFTAKKISGFA